MSLTRDASRSFRMSLALNIPLPEPALLLVSKVDSFFLAIHVAGLPIDRVEDDRYHETSLKLPDLPHGI